MRRLSRLLTARDRFKADLCVVGGGPAGLSAAIRYKQLMPQSSVVVLERGADIGSHLLSLSCIDPRAIYELFPNWRSLHPPPFSPVPVPSLLSLSSQSASSAVPASLLPHYIRSSSCISMSLPALSLWLSELAKEMGVEIFPGFAVNEPIVTSRGYINGVTVAAIGKSATGQKESDYQPSFDIESRQVILAEGTRGLISEKMISQFRLRSQFEAEREPTEQTYAIGFKEKWTVPHVTNSDFVYTFHWPLDKETFGYGFLLSHEGNTVEVGFVLGLDYKNPHLDPFATFQCWKTHTEVQKYIASGECVGFGAKAIPMGGLHSVPKLSFPGGVLAGCSAGLFNPAQGKGVHTAMKSGIIAAEAVAELGGNPPPGTEAIRVNEKFRRSWLWDELHETRNFRQGFYSNSSWGLLQAYVSSVFSKGKRSGYTVKPAGFACPDSERTLFPDSRPKILYPAADSRLTFTKAQSFLLANSVISAGNRDLIRIRKEKVAESIKSLRDFEGIEASICPTGALQTNASGDLVASPEKCILCKACEVKSPGEYLQICNPDGGEGPNYKEM